MLEILTAEDMRKIEAAAIAQGASRLQLIESAGASVAAHITRMSEPRPVLFLCGPGNNGADGFVAARRLKKNGWPVRVAVGAAC